MKKTIRNGILSIVVCASLVFGSQLLIGRSFASVDSGDQLLFSAHDNPGPEDEKPAGGDVDPGEGGEGPEGGDGNSSGEEGEPPDAGDNGSGEDDEDPEDPEGTEDPDGGDENSGEDDENPDDEDNGSGGDGKDPDGDGEDPDEDGEDPDEDGEDPDGDGEDPGVEEENPGQEETPDALPELYRLSDNPVPGYYTFDVDNWEDFIKYLKNTAYGAGDFADYKNVYIRMTGSFSTKGSFEVHSSIEKVVLDGNNRQYTLTEGGTDDQMLAGSNVKEIYLKDLNYIGRQYYGVFRSNEVEITYIYDNIYYNGPQLLYGRKATARLINSTVEIVNNGGNSAEEVAEAKAVFIEGTNALSHSNANSFFWVFGGDITFEENASLNVNGAASNYCLHPNDQNTSLIMKDGSSFVIRGGAKRFTGGSNLASVQLGPGAVLDMESSAGSDLHRFTTNGSGSGIHLDAGAKFRLMTTGGQTGSTVLVDVVKGDIVVGEGAEMLVASTGSYSSNYPAIFLEGTGGRIDVRSAGALIIDLNNGSTLNYGLVRFAGTGAQLTAAPQSFVMIRGNSVGTNGAVSFAQVGTVQFADPDYVEIAVSTGKPFHFTAGGSGNLNVVEMNSVQQLNYWPAGSAFHLDGGTPTRRWHSTEGGFDLTVRIQGNNAVNSASLQGEMDENWETDASNVMWSSVPIFTMGRLSVEVDEVPAGADAVTGALSSPNFSRPEYLSRYGVGAVALYQVTETGAEAVSRLADADPAFSVSLRSGEPISPADTPFVWAQYRYLFEKDGIRFSGPPLSFTVPETIEFPQAYINLSDVTLSALDTYAVQVMDYRGGGSDPWKVSAVFLGFKKDNVLPLGGILKVNDTALGDVEQQIGSANGTKNLVVTADLDVPGGMAQVGSYTGSIEWYLTDAP